MTDRAFAPLLDCLDRYSAAGRVATMWWRDDDASAPSPALQRLLALAATHDLPLALAVVPAQAGEALASSLASAPPGISVLQHGYAHQNHAIPAEKSIELGPQRPAQVVIGELATGRLRLETLFGARALPVLVPPWNRLAPHLVPVLPELGYRGLSQFGPRKRIEPVSGLRQVNCHLDPIAWRTSRGFVGIEPAVAQLAAHLMLRLAAPEGSATADEPTGLLTHHQVHDEAMWQFLDHVLTVTKSHRAVRWLGAREAFGT